VHVPGGQRARRAAARERERRSGARAVRRRRPVAAERDRIQRLSVYGGHELRRARRSRQLRRGDELVDVDGLDEHFAVCPPEEEKSLPRPGIPDATAGRVLEADGHALARRPSDRLLDADHVRGVEVEVPLGTVRRARLHDADERALGTRERVRQMPDGAIGARCRRLRP
jgi:hypothetical protein